MRIRNWRRCFASLVSSFLIAIASAGAAPNPNPRVPDFSRSDQGRDHVLWQSVIAETNQLGQIGFRTNSYVELETGKNYKDRGRWLAAREHIEITDTNAVALEGNHKAKFAANVNTVGALDLLTGDNKRLRSRVLGLAYYDYKTNRSVLIAELQDSIGLLVGENQVIYTNAFTDFRADVRYTYTKAGIEQDIIIHERPPLPEEYGLNPASTRLEVWTEFFDDPKPIVDEQVRRGWLLSKVARTISFGEMKIGQGIAFGLGDSAQKRRGVLVEKRWEKIDGRSFLVEEVPFKAIIPALRPLSNPGHASLESPPDSFRHRVSERRLLPAVRVAAVEPKDTIQIAQLEPETEGLVIDYALVTSQDDYTFRSDTTYRVSGTLFLGGTTIIEGGTVIKYDRGAELNVLGPLTCNTEMYRPAILTAVDDDSVGLPIGNSPSGVYASAALALNYAAELRNLHIRYADEAIYCGQSYTIRNCQIVHAYRGLHTEYATVYARNVLMNDVQTCFYGSYYYVNGQHLTLDVENLVADDWNFSMPGDCEGGGPSSYIDLLNTIISQNAYGYGIVPIYEDHVANLGTGGAETYQSAGAGTHYLANNSSYRDQGTPYMDSILAADLQNRTTFPPFVASNINLTSNGPITLAPVVSRDTNAADYGYHYAPLDYLWSKATFGPPLTLTNGLAVGFFGSVGFSMTNGNGGISIAGRPDAMNRLLWYPSVQEQAVKLNNVATYSSVLFDIFNLNNAFPKFINLSFTDMSMQGWQQSFFGTAYPYFWPIVTARDCWFRGVKLTVMSSIYGTAVGNFGSIDLQNNLLERSTIILYSGAVDYFGNGQAYIENALGASFYNNLFRNSSIFLTHNDVGANYPMSWNIKDNVFEATTISFNGNGSYQTLVTRWNNGFYYPADSGQLGGASNVFLTSVTYATGPFGPYYIASSSPTLIDSGSRSAPQANLYHYTIQPDQTKEGGSQVDIGFHYVAADSDGTPMDSDADDLPDYLEDRNGNGNFDGGETDWAGHCYTASSGLVGWWRAQGDANDSASTNHGSTPNGVSYVSGRVGQAFSFNGSGQRVIVPDNDSLKITSSLTIEGWVLVRGPGFLFFRGDNRAGLDPYALTIESSGVLQLLITPSSGPLEILQSPSPVPTGKWIHVAATLDGSTGDMYLYINGATVAHKITSARPFRDLSPSNSPAIGIGGCGTSGYFPFNGLIDEIAIYNTALSAAQIQGIRGSGVAGKCLLGPSILVQPVSQSVAQGGNATFSVLAAGASPLTYQWRYNGVNISGATASSYTKNNVQPADAGAYSVVVANSVGSITSADAQLSLSLAITLSAASMNYTVGSAAALIDSSALIIDPGSSDYNGGSLTISSPNGQSDDSLTIKTNGASGLITVSVDQVKYNGATIGTVAGGNGNTSLVISFTSSSATRDGVQELLRNIRFYTFPKTVPLSLLPRTLQFVLNDGHGHTTTSVSKDILLSADSQGFLKGVNLGGSQEVTIEGKSWLNYADSQLFGLTAPKAHIFLKDLSSPNPSAPADTVTMLGSMLITNRVPGPQTPPPYGFTYFRDDTADWAYRTVNFSSLPSGYILDNGTTYQAWCIDQPHPDVTGNNSFNCNLYYSSGSVVPNYSQTSLNKVNWILNNKPGVSPNRNKIIQCAIWQVLGQTVSGCVTQPADVTAVQNLANNADTHPDFIPGPNDISGVVIVPDQASSMKQILICEVPPSRKSVSFQISQPIVYGDYTVYLWLAESDVNNGRILDINIEGVSKATGVGLGWQLGHWEKLGPYSTTVSDGTLNIEIISPSCGDPVMMGLAIFGANLTPVADGKSVTTSEDTAVAITLSGSDPEGHALTYPAIVSGPLHGSLTEIRPNITYTPAQDFFGSDSFKYIVRDDAGQDSAPATVSITVTPVNDPPVVTLPGPTISYNENGAPVIIDSTATVTDVDSADFNGGNLTCQLSSGGLPEDRLAIRNQGPGGGQIGVSGNQVTFGGVLIGTFSGGLGTVPLVVSFVSANATPAVAQALLRNITYQNLSDNPSTSSRTFQVTVKDGDGGSDTSVPVTKNINVGTANDPPIVILPRPALDYTENDPPKVISLDGSVVDLDSPSLNGGSMTAQLAINGQAEDRLAIVNQGTGAGQIGISGSQVTYGGVAFGTFSGVGTTTLTITFNSAAATPAAAQALVRNITYQNVSENPSTLIRTFRVVVSDDHNAASTPATKQITVKRVNDAPVVTLPGPAVSFKQADPPTLIDTNATVTDVDSADFNGGNLTALLVNAQNEDRLAIRNQGNAAGQIGVSGNQVKFGGTIFGTFLGGSGSQSLVVTFINGAATPIVVQSLLTNLTYQDVSANPVGAQRTFRVTVNDGDGGTSTAVTKPINIIPLNPLTISLTLPHEGDVAYAPVQNLPVSATVGGGIPPYTVQFFERGSQFRTMNGAGPVFPTTWPASGSITYPGVYQFTANVIDATGQNTLSAAVNITVNLFTVDAGPDQTIVFPAQATMNGSVNGGNAPYPIIYWSELNGPPELPLGDNLVPANAVYDPATHNYTVNVIRGNPYLLTWGGNELGNSVPNGPIFLTKPANGGPLAFTAQGDTIVLSCAVAGAPVLAKVFARQGAHFADNPAYPTDRTKKIVSFDATGAYQLRLFAQDTSGAKMTDVAKITVLTNRPPIVDAGPDRRIILGAAATLSGSASDDGVPGPLTLTWSKVDGPGGVTFADQHAAQTTATFSQVGAYTLKLKAEEPAGGLSSEDTMQVVVVTSSMSVRTYTRDVDFAEGEVLNLNFEDEHDQLQINTTPKPFPFVYVACSARGTVVRIDAETGQILGEYYTGPTDETFDHEEPLGRSSSRTTVDRYGNVWVANRGDIEDPPGSGQFKGSITRIGLVIGGTRCNVNGAPDPFGQYLKGPFAYNTCKDRHGATVGTSPDGLIKTSYGRNNILNWTKAGGLIGAEDEAIINYTFVVPSEGSIGTRTLAVDSRNNVWVGGYRNHLHQLIDGKTGQPIALTQFSTDNAEGGSGGGYGGLIDRNGVLWTANSLVRFDPARRFNFNFNVEPPTATVVDSSYYGKLITGNYGVGIDPRNGNIWVSTRDIDPQRIQEVLPDGTLGRSGYPGTLNIPSGVNLIAQGIVVSADGDIWLAQSLADSIDGSAHAAVCHLHAGPNPTDPISFVGVVSYPCSDGGENGAERRITGVTIDHFGKVWGTAQADNKAVRINPNAGPVGFDGIHRVGEVDLLVDLGPGAGPYNYSDMSGYVTLGSIPSGTWTVIHDSGTPNTIWGQAAWTREPSITADSGKVTIEVHAANDRIALADVRFKTVAADGPGSVVPAGTRFTGTLPTGGSAISGQYVEIRVTLDRGPASGGNISPVLKDFTISSVAPAIVADNNTSLVVDDHFTVFRASTANVLEVLTNDTPLPNTSLTITSVTAPQRGTVTRIKGDTQLSYTPNADEFGDDQFAYTVSDGHGGVDRAVVSLRIAVNSPRTPAPIARDDAYAVEMDSVKNAFFVLNNDTDSSGESLKLVGVSEALHGEAKLSCDHILYTPAAGFTGTEQLFYTVENSRHQQAGASITIDVTPPATISCDTITNDKLTPNSPLIPRSGGPYGAGSFHSKRYVIQGSDSELASTLFMPGSVWGGVILKNSAGDTIAGGFNGPDLSFSPDVPGRVLSILSTTSSGWLFAGETDTLGSGPGYVHFDSYPLLDIGADHRVSSLAELGNSGYALLGGSFTLLNGISHNYLARVNLANGALDSDTLNLNGAVYCLQKDFEGKVLVGGAFTSIGGQSRTYLARLTTSGAFDASFVPPALPGPVRCIVTKSDGSIWVGGKNTSGADGYVVRITYSSGTTPFTRQAVGGAVLSMVEQTWDVNPTVFVGGEFSSIGGQSSSYLARLDGDGNVDVNFHPVLDQPVYSVEEQRSQTLVGGAFTSVNGLPRRHLARINLDGSVDSYFALPANDNVLTLAYYYRGGLVDDDFLVGGEFTSLGGLSSPYVRRVTTSGDTASLGAHLQAGQSYTLEVTTASPGLVNTVNYALMLNCSGSIVSHYGVYLDQSKLPTGSKVLMQAGPGDRPSVDLIVRNEGVTTITISNPHFEGSNPGDFDQSLGTSTPLSAGETAIMNVQLNSTVEGLHTATLKFTTDSSPATYTLNLQATYTAVNSSLAPKIKISAPIAEQVFTTPATVNLIVNATPASGRSITKVEYYADSGNGYALLGEWPAIPPVAADWHITRISTGGHFKSGEHYVYAIAYHYPGLGYTDPVQIGGVDGLNLASAQISHTGVIPQRVDKIRIYRNRNSGTTMPDDYFLLTEISTSPGTYSDTENYSEFQLRNTARARLGPVGQLPPPADPVAADWKVTKISSDGDFNDGEHYDYAVAYHYAVRGYTNPVKIGGVDGNDQASAEIKLTGLLPIGVDGIRIYRNRNSGTTMPDDYFLLAELLPHPASYTDRENYSEFTLRNTSQAQLISAAAQEYVFTWDPPAKGTYILDAIAYDDHSLAAVASPVAIHVRDPLDNQDPIAVKDHITVPKNAVNFKIWPLLNDHDPDGDPIAVLRFTQAQNGNVVQDGNCFLYTPPEGAFGDDLFTYTIHDGRGGIATASVYIKVPGSFPPTATLAASPTSISASQWPAPPPIVLTATVADDKGVKLVTFLSDGEPLVSLSTAPYQYSWNDYPGGAHIVEVMAIDTDDNVGWSDPVTVVVAPPAGNHPPIADIYNVRDEVLGDGTTHPDLIREGVFKLKGTAKDSPLDAGNSIRHKVNIYTFDNQFVSTTPWMDGAVAGPDGDLRELDFTSINNGNYILELVVQDGTGTGGSFRPYSQSEKTVNFVLNTELHIGRLTFSQDDVTIEVNGYPLTATRNYDSWNKEKGEMGFGWTFGFNAMQVELNEFRNDVWDEFGEEKFSMRDGGGRDVTITMPDGRRTTFIYNLRDVEYDTYGPAEEAYWQAEPGVEAKLTTLNPASGGYPGDNSLVTGLAIFTSELPPYWFVSDPRVPTEQYDFRGFVLTLEDGTKYFITRGKGEVHAVLTPKGEEYYPVTYGKPTVTKVERPDGTYTLIDGDKITSWSKNGQKLGSIVVKRDDDQRIIGVYGPNSLTGDVISGPATIIYEYDNAGNLYRVHHLVKRDTQNTPPNHEYKTLKYIYDDPQPGNEHLITRVEDPRGIPTLKYRYDAQGRLMGVTDATHPETFVTRDAVVPGTPQMNAILALAPTAKRMETTTDISGNKTISVSDELGNVVYQEDALHRKTLSTYDRNKNQVTGSDALNADNLLVSRTLTSYEYGFAGSEVPSKITITQVMVDINGNPVDGQDLVTVNTFDIQGRPIKSTDPTGKYAKNTYFSDDNTIAPGELQKTEIFHDHGTPDDENDDGPALQRQVWNEYYDGTLEGGKFIGLLRRTLDQLGNQTVIYYYDGTEYDSGGEWGRKWKEERRDPTGNKLLSLTIFTYDADGNVLTESQARNNETDLITTERQYDELCRVILERDPEQGETKTVYDDGGLVEYKRDRYGFETHYLYDAAGEVIQTTHADGSIVRSITVESYQFELGRYGRATIQELPHFADETALGTRSVYDEAGQEIRTERLENINIEIKPNGGAYDAIFHEESAVILSTVRYEYDAAGRPQSATDGEGNKTAFGYDGYGRRNLVKTWTGTPPNRKRHQILTTFNKLGNPVSATITVTPVDSQDQPVAGPVETVNTVEHRYDKLGRRWLTISHDDTYGDTFTRNVYNEIGLIVEKIDQDGVSTQNEYDEAGRLTAATKAFKIYDPAHVGDNEDPGTLVIIPPDPPLDQTVTRFKYNLLGALVEQTDANQSVLPTPKSTTFTYDKLGRRLSRTLPEGKSETWLYDGNVMGGQWPQKMSHEDFNHTVVRSEFDKAGRLVAKAPVSSLSVPAWAQVPVAFSYDSRGQRKTMTDASGTTEYQYDNRGRLWKKTVEQGTQYTPRTLTYNYDNNDHLLTISSSTTAGPGPTALAYQYDERARLKTANGTTYTYDAAGNLKTVTYPTTTPVVTTYNYNSINRLTDVAVAKGGSTFASFNYNPSDRRLGRTGVRRAARETINVGVSDSIQRNVNYSYDRLYRLTVEDIAVPAGNTVSGVDAGTITYDATVGYDLDPPGYGYDRVGNRRSRTVSSAALQAKGVTQYSGNTFDRNDRISSCAAFTYKYDDNGNTLRGQITPNQANTPDSDDLAADDQYDVENRLVRRQTANRIYEIVYDADGNRVRKVTKQLDGTEIETIHYLVDDRNPTGYAQVLEEWTTVGTATATLRRAYSYGHELIKQVQNDGTTHYYGYDGHGNVRTLLNASGQVTDAYTYDAFGILIHDWHAGTPTQNSYLYCGEQWDSDLGMYFLRARYMNPSCGTFWTMDSFEGVSSEPQSLHKYLYTHADPVNYADPSGHTELLEKLIAIGKQLGFYAWRGLDLKKKIDKTFQPWVSALVIVNMYNVWMSEDIPDEVKVPALIVNAYYLTEFNRQYKKNSSKTLQRIKRLWQWVTNGIGSRKFHSAVETSAAGFPRFKEEHLYQGGLVERIATTAAALFDSQIKEWFSGLGSPVLVDRLGTVLNHLRKLRNQTFIFYGGSRSKDFRRANIVTLHGLSDEPPSGATWHHHEVIGIMQLVQSQYHSGNYHKGGVLMYQILKNVDNYP